ncbi:hypothetical protein [Pelomonas sp. KK5]|uniref:aldose epimerase family protein n=1 Tax=Pelomonas sp. KK5 TaxID=1855730 RepID=UPI00097BF596|nr:hypothetical protein [Pelomonas sp. KK5]
MIPQAFLQLNHGAASAAVDPLGAELRSLRGAGGGEVLWQDGPGLWPHAAPVLFPFVGRLRDGGHQLGARWHAMKIHGFADALAFDTVEQREDALTLELNAGPATREAFPFDFRLRVDFALGERSLRVGYEVLNREAERAMHFGLGSHPAFALDGALDDWRVAFDAEELPQAFRLDGALLATRPEPFAFDPPRCVTLGPRLFERDALIFKQVRSQDLTLIHRTRGPRLRLHTGAAPHLGLWARPGAGYVCIEPWFGHDDDANAPLALAAKPQLVALAPGQAWRTHYRIELLGNEGTS